MGQDPEREQANKALMDRAFDDWAAGTGGPFALLADDASWTIVGNSSVAGRYEGRQAFLDAVIRPFNARLATPLVPVVRAIRSEDDWVIVLFDASATARGGEVYENTYTWHMRLRGGRVVEVIAFFDAIAFDRLWDQPPREAEPAE